MENEDMTLARELLREGGYTCVLRQGDRVYTSQARGVRPLVQWLEQKLDVAGFSAADRVVGRATAYLYVLLGVRAVFAGVISRPALAVFQANAVACSYDTLVDNIINRSGDGICPFEEATLHAATPSEAYRAIREKMEQMHIPV